MNDRPTLLLDGGLGHLLKENGLQLSSLPYEQQFLAGAIANENQPDLVQQAHQSYLRCGSDVISTNTFVCTPYNLAKIGRANDLTNLLEAAASIAHSARRSHNPEALIAGSIPPLKESYQVADLGTDDEICSTYKMLIEVLSPLVDILLLETLATVREVRNASRAAASAGKPVWVSVTLEDSTQCRLRSGECLEDAMAAALAEAPNLNGFLVNCCAAGAVTAAMPVLAAHLPTGTRYGGYANGFKVTTTEWMTGQASNNLLQHEGDYDSDGIITPKAYARYTQEWMDQGASIVGGCCGVGPEHIQLIRGKIDAL